MELFWTNGYDATSVPDLTEHLGVFPGSLYRTFGDKHGLFLRALEHYRDTQSRTLAPLLLQEGPVLPRIRAVMVGYLEIAAQEGEPRGCLIANTAGERLPGDRAVASLLADVLAVVEDGFLQGLREADRRGELRAGLDLPADADHAARGPSDRGERRASPTPCGSSARWTPRWRVSWTTNGQQPGA